MGVVIMRTTSILLLASFALAGCLADEKLKQPVSMTPRSISDGWAVSTPEKEGMDEAAIADVYDRFFKEDAYQAAQSLIIVRHGKIIAEGYTRDDADAFRLNNLKSATKSVTSLLVGLAIDKGYLKAVTQTVGELLPDYADPASVRGRLTLEKFLTMQSGLHWDNGVETDELMINRPADTVAFALDQKFDFDPGDRFHYSDGQALIVSGIIEAASEMPTADFADEVLFAPLGIDEYRWESGRDGTNYGAFGLYLKPRDFAKIGQMALRNGAWGKTQVVSASWITASTQTHANLNAGPYGYFWWVRPDFGAFMADGHGGQYLYAIPSKDLLIVETANPFIESGLGVQPREFEDLVLAILEAVKD